MTILFTVLMAGFGFTFIYLNWKTPDKDTQLNNWIGWSLALSSIVLLVLSDGAEFGIAYGLFGLAAIPFLFVLLNSDIRTKPRTARNTDSEDEQRSPLKLSALKGRTVRNIGYFIIVVPVSLVFSLLALMLLSGLSGSAEINRLALIVIGFPFIWATISYLYLFSQHKKKFGSALTLSTLVLSAITFA